jgi:hypothetical protein
MESYDHLKIFRVDFFGSKRNFFQKSVKIAKKNQTEYTVCLNIVQIFPSEIGEPKTIRSTTKKIATIDDSTTIGLYQVKYIKGL